FSYYPQSLLASLPIPFVSLCCPVMSRFRSFALSRSQTAGRPLGSEPRAQLHPLPGAVRLVGGEEDLGDVAGVLRGASGDAVLDDAVHQLAVGGGRGVRLKRDGFPLALRA